MSILTAYCRRKVCALPEEAKAETDNFKSSKMDKEKIKAFKVELKALLKKYNADIWVSLDGDTHGVSSIVMIDVDGKTVIEAYSDLTHKDIKVK